MKSIYLVLGARNTRKSSLVRSLIGTDNSTTQVEVRRLTGLAFRIRGIIGAAQEQECLPEAWLDMLNGQDHWLGVFSSVRNVNVAIQLRHLRIIHP